MSLNDDYCPDMGRCPLCDRPLCRECQGEADPHECAGDLGWHCGGCIPDCPACDAAIDEQGKKELT